MADAHENKPPGWLQAHHDRWHSDPALVDATLMECGVVPVGVERIVIGQSNEVYRVETQSGGPLVVRVAHGSPRFETEAAVIERARSLGVPAPEVLVWHHFAPSSGATGIMVQRFLRGTRLQEVAQVDPGSARAAMRDAGRWLAVMHEVVTDGFGGLDRELCGEHATYGEWFVDALVGSQLEQIRASVVIDPGALAMVDDAANLIIDNRRLIDSQTARLAHGDFSPNNILVDEGQVTGIVDWEAVKGGPRVNDLAWWVSIAPDEIARIDPLLEGYGQDLGDPDAVPLMFLLAQMRILMSMLLFANRVENADGYSRSRQQLHEVLSRARLII